MPARALVVALVFAALLAAGAPGSAAAAAKTKTETATNGQVTAVLTYQQGSGLFNVSGTHLKIERAGATLLDADVTEPCGQCPAIPAGAGGGKSLQIRDLDGDGEPEVLLDMYSGGAHCCSYSWIYRFDNGAYTRTSAFWGDVGYALVDLNHDGVPELRSYDDRFAYTFTDFADSWFPSQIWRYRAGKLIDVTRKFKRLIAREARKTLHAYRRYRRKRDVRGVVAAYVADQYLLRRPARGWRLVRSARRHGFLKGFGRFDSWPRGARYARALRKHLRRWGYA